MGEADDRRPDDAGTAPTLVSVGGEPSSSAVRSRADTSGGPSAEQQAEILRRYELLDEVGRGG
ncbi:MAG TPA: hypothetical protein RMH99_24500, partial [Sandaracinaceae bacterium LLY-WYZ-13_1]|nr:hypothetical protein [Sandaracinaceae bacterium LLY-WYZ-13_1]